MLDGFVVCPAEVENTVGRFTITPCTPCFLVVMRERMRYLEVNDESDVGFVDSHTECDGCRDNAKSITRPPRSDWNWRNDGSIVY